MPNNFINTLYTILTNAAIEAFTAILTPLTVFARNYSSDAVQRGDKVKVLWIPTQAEARDFQPTGSYAPGDITATGLDVVIDRHKFVSWSTTDTELSLNPIINIQDFGRQMGSNLGIAVLQDVWTLLTAVNYPRTTPVGPATDFDSDNLIDVKAQCDGAHWPAAGRNVVLSGTHFNGLLKDGSLKNAAAYGGPEAIRAGAIPALVGFGVYDSQLVPTTGSLCGFATMPDAILIAMRYLAPQEGNTYFQAGPVSHEGGLTLGFRDFYENIQGRRIQVLEANYGFLKGNGDALIRLTTLPPAAAEEAEKAA
ncbi:MAG: hypothetical protein JO081_16355 [Alphaproteobacteria bacterium]|nr:hypothetical protein [Alphaproteobacteria bacterium]